MSLLSGIVLDRELSTGVAADVAVAVIVGCRSVTSIFPRMSSTLSFRNSLVRAMYVESGINGDRTS